MESITLTCLTRSILGLEEGEKALGDVDIARIESALKIWEPIPDNVMCEMNTHDDHHFVAVSVLRDTRCLRDVVRYLTSGGLKVPVSVNFEPELSAAHIEAVIELFADGVFEQNEQIAALAKLMRELSDREVREEQPSEAESAARTVSHEAKELLATLEDQEAFFKGCIRQLTDRIEALEDCDKANDRSHARLHNRIVVLEGGTPAEPWPGSALWQVPEHEKGADT